MSKSPKPAPGGANAHREEENDDQDPVPTGTPGGFDGGDGGGGGGPGQPPASGSSGVTAAIPMRKVAIAGAAIVAGYLLYRYAQQSDAVQVERDLDEPDQEPDGGVQPEGNVRVDQDGNPIIPDDPEDPLKADHEAGYWVFGDMGWGE